MPRASVAAMGDLTHALTAHRMTTRAKVLTFDIETRPMLGYFWAPKTRYVTPEKVIDYGGMMSFAAKWYGHEDVEFRSDRDDGHDDMVKRLHVLLDRADIVVGYNSDRFDIKRVNVEFARLGLSEPSPFRSVDLIKTVRRKFDFPYARLDEVSREFGITNRKMSHEGFALWTACINGDDDAWDRMKAYNMQDVRLTEVLYDAMRSWIPNHPNLALWAGHDEDGRPKDVCCNCGASELELVPGKSAMTAMTAYALVECQSCRTKMRRNFVKERVALRPVNR